MRLVASAHVERVYPREVEKCGVRDARLVAARHIERVYTFEVDECGIRDTHLITIRQVDPPEVDERGDRMPIWLQHIMLSV